MKYLHGVRRFGPVIVVVALAFPFGAIGAPAPGASRTLAHWFESLQAPDTSVSCCAVSDCRLVTSRYREGHYEVWLRERWVVVPDEKIIDDTENPNAAAVLCQTETLGIMCFVPEATE